MEPMIITAIAIGVGAPTLVGGGLAAAVYLGLFPPTPRDLGGARDLDSEARKVKIAMPDGDHLDAWFLHGSHPTAILLLHGFGRTHHRMWRYAGFLRRAGHPLLAIDFRSSRRRRRMPTTLGVLEQEDARAALDWLIHQPGVGSVVVMGESLGATTALLVGGEDPRVKAVIADCPFADGRGAVEDMLGRFLLLPRGSAAGARAMGRWATGHDLYRVDAGPAAALLRNRPVLFIHSMGDRRLAPAHTERLWEAAGSKDPVWWVPEAGHNQAWLRHRHEYETRVMGFLAQVLGSPESVTV